ncbi:MAG: AMP-binding protein [Clostridia bacterium]|nr:AMP-binding protein [Clostridia bacterium]
MKNEILHEKTEFANVRELVEWAAETYGEKNAYSFRRNPHDTDAVQISFAQFRDDVRALASEFHARGWAGKHIALIGKMSYDWALSYFAALATGSVLIPLDRDWTAEDLTDTIGKANADLLFCDEDISEKATAIANAISFMAPPVLLSSKKEASTLITLVRKGYTKLEAQAEAYFNTYINPSKMSLLVFTSGTTGKGKGVMLSQTAILSCMSSVTPYIDFSEKTLGVLPPHHTYGSTVMLIGHLSIGSEIYISGGIRYIMKELKEQQPGHLVLVPLYLETFYRKILANIKEQGKLDLVMNMIKASNAMRKIGIDMRTKLFSAIRAAFGGKIKMIISGGAPINPDILKFFDAIGIATLNGYGITECAPLIAVNRSLHVVPGSVGSIIDIDTVKIREPNENGEGEICVKGPNVMLGYYNDEAATAAAFDREGYFRTGDYGKLGKNNILYITGRKKNLIILSNGKNVYPEEIESVLNATPGVLDIIVYEGQSKRGMEHNAIVAEIYPDQEYLEKNNITDAEAHLKPFIDAYNRTAVPYKKIGVLKVRTTEFPKNTLRKILRFKLDTTID